jgi:uncharacterized RDD family membrane protein YckC
MALAKPAFEACPNHPEIVSGLIRCARCGVSHCADCVVELDGRPYDANCKEEQVRDLRSGVSGVDLASAGRRFGGAVVDGLVFSPVYIGLTLAFPGAGIFDQALIRLVLPALLLIAYEAWMLVQFNGQTLGKKAMGTRVINPDGSAITVAQALKRALSRNLMAYTYILGPIDALMVYSDQRRTLHDRAAKTLVVNWKP